MPVKAITFKFKPIVDYPVKATNFRESARFKAKYSDTLDLLDRELFHISAQSPVIIQTYLDERDIRLDGLPRSDARVPSNPAVIISFKRRVKYDPQLKRDIYEDLSFPCDTFTTWKDNLRAIALALEALRKVDRYGVTKNGEQYRGWKALPPQAINDFEDKYQAAKFIFQYSQMKIEVNRIVAFREDFETAYKQAARKLHPDAGGSHDAFLKLQRAAEVLKNHFTKEGN